MSALQLPLPPSPRATPVPDNVPFHNTPQLYQGLLAPNQGYWQPGFAQQIQDGVMGQANAISAQRITQADVEEVASSRIQQQWELMVRQLANGNQLVVISAIQYESFNEEELHDLLTLYKATVRIAPMVVRDTQKARYFIAPPSFFAAQNLALVPGHIPVFLQTSSIGQVLIQHATAQPPNPTPTLSLAANSTTHNLDSDGKKIKRPPNAWIMYRSTMHNAVANAHPGLTNNQLSRIIGNMWSQEREPVKQAWRAAAQNAKDEHLKKYPEYSYKPRKSAEVKRRKSKKKEAALAQAAAAAALVPLPANLQAIAGIPTNAQDASLSAPSDTTTDATQNAHLSTGYFDELQGGAGYDYPEEALDNLMSPEVFAEYEQALNQQIAASFMES